MVLQGDSRSQEVLRRSNVRKLLTGKVLYADTAACRNAGDASVTATAYCAVWPETAGLMPEAQRLAAAMALPVAAPDAPPAGFRLVVCTRRLELYPTEGGQLRGLQVAFAADGVSARRYRQVGAANEGLLRAIGARRGRRPGVIDATAGLGRDALLMAAAGCRVTMVERSPILAAMLRHALAHPAAEFRETIGRLSLHQGDALECLPALPTAEVIYLDPMYAAVSRRARQAREMEILQRLLGTDRDPGALLATALSAAGQRVVVKRPRKADVTEGRAPDHRIEGRSTRFDVYLRKPADGAD